MEQVPLDAFKGCRTVLLRAGDWRGARMPEFQYWWTLAAFVVVVGTAFPLAVGIVGVKLIVPKRTYWTLWGISMVVAGAAWFANAKQASDAAQDHRDLLASMNRSDPKPVLTLPDRSPAWLTAAYKELGQSEIPGLEENPHIVAYFKALESGRTYHDDRDDWASPFVEWSLQQAGKFGPRSIKPADWLSWGKASKPTIGAIVVLNFSGLQHVGFYFGEDSDFVRVLGGNQNDAVSVFRYPKSAVRAYRVP
jgi:uncharacterized protein (TIGR02594 family)